MTCRMLAADVLSRVIFEDAYAAAALSSALSRSGLEARDRALATELVYGVLRTQTYLLRRLSAFGKIKESDREILVPLLIAAYQIDFLDRVPARAAIFEAVEAVGRSRGKKVGGFANAILRAQADSVNQRAEDLEAATIHSTPSWIRKRLIRDVGEAAMVDLVAPRTIPRPHLRLLVPQEEIPWLETDCTAVPGVRDAFSFRAGGDPRTRQEFLEGKFVVQELGAQLVALSLGARRGERVLDACAGRGQKSTLLARQVGPDGQVVATDLHAHKIRMLEEEARRLDVSVVASPWDWTTEAPPDWRGGFDRVLVDAPCSGVGTLRRRPEIMRRLTPEDPERLAALQERILKNAALTLRPGGVLSFATCSVFREEAEQVVERICSDVDLHLTPFEPATDVDPVLFPAPDGPVREGLGVQSLFRLLPHIHGTDGYFVARLRRG